MKSGYFLFLTLNFLPLRPHEAYRFEPCFADVFQIKKKWAFD
jgi:hypothetical protein